MNQISFKQIFQITFLALLSIFLGATIALLGVSLSVIIFICSCSLFFIKKFKIVELRYLPSSRALQILIISSVFAIFFAKNEQTRSSTLTEIEHAKVLLEKREYEKSIAILEDVLRRDTSQDKEVTALLNFAKNFTSEDSARKTMLALPKDEFFNLRDGKNITLQSNPILNADLQNHLRKKAKAFETVYLSVNAEEERLKKSKQLMVKLNAKRIERFGPFPQKSTLNGSYFEVKTFLAVKAHDPESINIIECTDVSVDDSKGWLVGCDYRGKNGFGALIRNSNWFVIRDGRVVQMLSSDSYKAGNVK